jgi:hypothetical protein
MGNPVDRSQLSPYPCTIIELSHKFSFTPHRINILRSFVLFRQRMSTMGIIFGFQWLNGSFLEDIETAEGRAPHDLDLVTFCGGLSPAEQVNIVANFPEFINPSLSKTNYSLDHYPIDIGFSPEVTVEQTRYWLQLFTHNRNSVWKGILRLPLNTTLDDQHALDYLNSI